MIRWIKSLFSKKAEPKQYVDQLDPHGDGTIRPGDDMYALLMDTLRTGKAAVVQVDKHGNIISNEEIEENKKNGESNEF